MITQELVSERTGFDRGELFTNEAEVWEYFTLANMAQSFGGHQVCIKAQNPDENDVDVVVIGYAEINPEHVWTHAELDEIDNQDGNSELNYFTESELTAFADAVIKNHWHMA